MRETVVPKIISDDDVKEEYPVLETESFNYDEELYDDEIDEFEREEIIRVDTIASQGYPPEYPSGWVVTGATVPIIYEDSIVRRAVYVNGQYQYRVSFTVTDVPGAVDYEIRVSEA